MGIVRRVATRILRKNNYSVFEASSAEEALELAEALQSTRSDLLITDVVMPGMNGRQLAEALLKTRPKLAVLYMSGSYSEDIVMHRGDPGSGDCLHRKDVHSPGFAEVKVRDVLDTHRLKSLSFCFPPFRSSPRFC